VAVREDPLQKLSDIFPRWENSREDPAPMDSPYPNMGEWVTRTRSKAEGEWFGAIAALEALLGRTLDDHYPSRGLILSGPTAIVSEASSLEGFEVGIFTVKALKQLRWMGLQLPSEGKPPSDLMTANISELPLLPHDPIANEQFCLVFTPKFSLIMVLGEDEWGLAAFQFAFDPDVVQRGWELLRLRLLKMRHPRLSDLDRLIEKTGICPADYRLVSEFSRLLLQYLPDRSTLEERKPRSLGNGREEEKIPEPSAEEKPIPSGIDLELLRALTHEVRTPLTTIRTITRLLLKRARVNENVQKHLETIDLECSEQIDRMELIFRAAELGINPIQDKPIQLVPISLDRVFQDSIPRWQKQAKRRNITLEVTLPPKLPAVISDPNLLDQMLSGVMEKCTRGVNSGGLVRVQVSTAGNQLKLQFHAQPGQHNHALKALGQVLMFQPETGSLSLNMDVTKNLFQALGGKFIVRQKPQAEEVMTIFLPLGRGR
jgi:signal transduction histidine kinase